MFRNTRRIIKNGFVSFKRNGFVSLSSILVVTITLSVLCSLLFLRAILNKTLDDIKNKVDVTIYFAQTAPEQKILDLKLQIEKLSEVDSTKYVSSEEVYDRFKAKYSNDTVIKQVLDILGGNPLGSELSIKAKNPSHYQSIVDFLDSDTIKSGGYNQYISKVNYFQNKDIIDRLNTLINGAGKLGTVVTLVLAIISIIITFNTIRLAIYIARDEIGIMKLVGANDSYIRGPFMVTGAIYGVISAVLTLLIFWPVSKALGNNMTVFLGIDMWEYYTANFWQIFFIFLFTGIFLGVISSFLATRKYLNQ